jgi:hypothetical protein
MAGEALSSSRQSKDTGDVRPERDRSSFSFSARAAAWWALGFATAAISGLVISLVTDDGDDLATVALVLAIVAFGLQIVFFALQLWVAAEQNRRGQELSSASGAVLTKMEARSEATVEVIKEQFAFVLRHALGDDSRGNLLSVNADTATEAVDEGGVHVDEPDDEEGADGESSAIEALAAEVEALKRSLARPRSELIERWDAIGRTPDLPTSASSRVWYSLLTSWPDKDDGERALKALGTLSAPERTEIERLARTMLRHVRKGAVPTGLGTQAPPEVVDGLASKGLVESRTIRDASGKVRPVLALTPTGRQVARLFTAQGVVPDWYPVPETAPEVDPPAEDT